ncbi:MAG: glycoside hydrolase family 2 TIM barrel-domain containing protein, partial [Bacteroidales bacterium]
IGPFSLQSPGGGATAYAIGGTAWYRKHFKLAEEDAGKRVILYFDGIYMESEVWVNGKRAGNHPYGYTAFWFDITPFLNDAGQENVVAVQVNNLGHNARWYSGSGIYRNVSLLVTDPLHVAVDGVYITTPEISDASAEVRMQLTVNNKSGQTKEAGIAVRLLDPEGVIAGETSRTVMIDPDGNTVVTEKVNIEDPRLWSLSSPDLYTAEVTVRDGEAISDVQSQTFGIRSVEISMDKGFVLNGEPMILKGGCMHHDNGLLGAAAFDRAEERRIEIMKANGFNAIRCAHNPPSKAFLDACDRLGMLVVDEIFDVWEQPKFMPDGAHLFFDEWWERDVESWILRDRNHPSVFMWSIGNEIMEAADSTGLHIARQLIDEVDAMDPSRPLSEAMQDMQGVFMGRSGWYDQEEHMALLDVVGYNYKDNYYVKDHKLYPEKIIYGSETFPLTSFEYWQLTEQLPWVIGDFVWTGMDYLGESALGNTGYVPEGTPEPPSLSDMVNSGVPMDMESMSAFMGALPEELPATFVAWCGDIDITGEKKPQMYFKDILWDNSQVEMLVHEPIPKGMIERSSNWGWPAEKHSWNWKGNEGTPLKVRVFTKGDRVVLELNGEKIGENAVSADTRYTAVFEVPYQPGELKATAYQDGPELGSIILGTTGNAVGIRLVADRTSIRADRNDLSFVSVLAVDENGETVKDASVQVSLSLSGDGELAATGNADPQDMASVNSRVVRTYNGMAQVILRPFARQGTMLLKASSEGLAPAELEIRVE